MKNPSEKSVLSCEDKMLRLNAGRVVYAVRKFHGYGQMELAEEFNISQSNISKIEAGVLAPDLRFWMDFIRVFRVKDPFCFYYGTAEIDGIPKLGQVGKNFYKGLTFRIPKHYQTDPVITSRKIRPMIEVLEKTLEKPWHAFLAETKIPHGIFDILNFPLPGLLIKDLADFFNKHAEKINFGVELNIETQGNHGLLFKDYDSSRTPLNVLKHFIQKQREYGVDFEYTMAQENGDVSSIGIKALPALTALVLEKNLPENIFFNVCAQYPLYLMRMKDASASLRLIWPSECRKDEARHHDLSTAPGKQVLCVA
ncbi:MAG: hypothetical protein A2X86_19720 [Bdellovibrionales bacterium GWA2_49_15]|nr:MAG: hypothetical protein A2X86_19720 [Bdellovibrionales bacterium GWA2_49_15]